jgi:hypothetical protein
MSARPYRPSGQLDDGVLPILFVGAAALAVVVGILEGLVSSWVNLIIIFPAIVGGAAGAFAAARIKSGHVRAPLIAALLAALAAAGGQAAVYGTRYYVFQKKMMPVAAELVDKGIAGDAHAALDAALLAKTGHSGFVGFMALTAENGIEIQHNGSKGPVLAGVAYWIYFAVEMLIALGAAFAAAWSAASKPFCEMCKRWYEQHETVAAGAGDRAQTKQVLTVLNDGRWYDVGAAMGTPTPKTRATLALFSCAGCKTSDLQLTYTVTARVNTKKPQSKIRYKTMLRADEAAMLRQGTVAIAATGT